MNDIDTLITNMIGVEKDYFEYAKKQGINEYILAIIHTVNACAPCPQKKICDEWCIPKQTISVYCKQMLAEGLLATVASEQDKREKWLIFTDKGREFAQPILQKMAQAEEETLQEFGETEMGQLLDLMKKFREILGKNLKG